MEMSGFQTKLELDAFLKAHEIEFAYNFEDLERNRANRTFCLKNDYHSRYVAAQLSNLMIS